MRRENRRVAAMSWGSSDDLPPPPKPSRYPMQGNSWKLHHLLGFNYGFVLGVDSVSLASLNSITPPISVPQTYIVAQNAEVLAHLMKENESRAVCPSAYTTPASVFNTISVQFDQIGEAPVLKTCPMVVQSFQKLDPQASDSASKSDPKQKQNSFERNISKSSGTNTPQTGSLERNMHIDQMSTYSSRMNSLERSSHKISSSRNSLDKSGTFSPKIGSLERKSHSNSPKMDSLERSIYFSNQCGPASPKLGSLERNSHLSFSNNQIAPSTTYDYNNLPNYHPNPTVYHISSNQVTKEMQQSEENIYDFGGVDVKSCAYKQPYYIHKLAATSTDKSHDSKMQVRFQA